MLSVVTVNKEGVKNAGWVESYVNWGAYITAVINCKATIKLTTAIWTREAQLFSSVSTKHL